MKLKNVLFTMALPEERFDMPLMDNVSVVMTKVGKARAAYILAKAICSKRPDLVVNIGSAGTVSMNVGDIVVSSHFFDRDLRPLSIEGVVSEIETMPGINIPSIVKGKESYEKYVVSTGDDFVTDANGFRADVIDMESFAQAMVCAEEQVNFVSVKYITDKVGCNSVKVWSEKLSDERTALAAYFKKYIMPAL